MSDYEPDFVYMIPIDYKTSEVFYQKFNKSPFLMRGALLVDEEKDEKVALSKAKDMCEKLLANLTIEDYSVKAIKE